MRIMRRKLLLIALALVTALTLCPVTALSMTNNQADNIQYAESYARLIGISVPEALHIYDLQQTAGALNAELMAGEAETFAGLWIEHTPSFKVVIQFTNGAEKYAESYAKGDLADVIELRTAMYTYERLRDEQEIVVYALRDLGIKFRSMVDIKKNCVSVDVTDIAPVNQAITENKLTLSEQVKINVINSMPIELAEMFGGLTLHQWGLLPGGTSGFSVRDAWGTRGITTAGHSPDQLYYYSPMPVHLPLVSQREGGSYDIQWHTSPLDVTNQILIDPSGTRQVIQGYNWRIYQAVGTLVFKYGRNTHLTYGLIGSIDATCPTVEDSNATFVYVIRYPGDPDLAAMDDSGGPWFVGNMAYGTTVAGDFMGNYAYYMPIDYIFGMGLTILTS